jgi:hypothetical protein
VTETPAPIGWAVLELMGHRRLAGYVSEQEIAGANFIRLDVPDSDTPAATQFYSPAAVYCITPTTEEIATGLARSRRPEPVQRWELPAARDDEPVPSTADRLDDDEF